MDKLGLTAPTFTVDGDGVIMTMGIPDERLGGLLGKGGSIIKEIMTQTSTQIKVKLLFLFSIEYGLVYTVIVYSC